MRYFECTSPDTIKYIVCGQLVSEKAFLHQRRLFDEHVLIMVTRGILFINSNGENYKVSEGMYIVLRASELHCGTSETSGKLSYFWIHFYGDMQVAGNSASEISFPEFGTYNPNGRLSVLFHQISDISFDDDSRARNMCNHAMVMILLELAKESSEISLQNSTCPIAVSGAMEWINKNYYQPFTVSELAKKYGYTSDYFSSMFKKSTGFSLVSYINSVRIRASRALLANYGVSIKEVAYSCGFPDEKYFMRVFKASEGLTPTQYRNTSGKAYINEQ